MMTDAMWAFLTTEIATMGAVMAAWIQFRKPVKKLGNGFSERVERDLQEIKRIASEARDEIRAHVNDHAKASMRNNDEPKH